MPYQKKLTDTVIQQAAVLIANENLSQLEAGKLLGMSAPTVNRAIQTAKKKGWLVQKLECHVSKEAVSEAKALMGGTLEKRLKNLDRSCNFQTLRVFSSSASLSFEERLKQVYLPAASFVADRLLDSNTQTVGVTWGVTLEYLVKALKEHFHRSPCEENPIKFYPVCGTPPDAELNLSRSPSHLASRLNTIFNRGTTNELAFSVGAWIPGRFTKAEMKIIKRYFETKPAFARVFGVDKKPSLIDRTDCILTSVGSSGEFAGAWLNDAADAGQIEPKTLQEMTVGNIMGCFLPKPRLSAKRKQIVEQINQRWTGITLAQLNHCAGAAPDKGMPGVLVIAVGRGKAQLIVESLKRGLINGLVIDSELAEQLELILPDL